MPITATTRSCTLCGTMLLEGNAACPKCAAVAVPPVADWTPTMRRWLVGQAIAMMFAPYSTDQARWEMLLRAVVAGRQWGTVVYPRAMTTLDAFWLGVKQSDEWERAGAGRLF